MAQIADVSLESRTNISIATVLFSAVVAFLVTFLMFSLVDFLSTNQKKSTQYSRHSWLIPTLSGIFLFSFWLILYLRYWPMASMNDTFWILNSPFGVANQHPLAYGIVLNLLVKIGFILFGSELAGIIFASVFQMLFWSLSASFVVWYLQKIGVRPILLGVFIAYFGLFPCVGDYSFSLVKDAYFSVFVLLLIPVLLETWRTRGKVLTKFWPAAGTIAVLAGFAVSRNNGKMALPIVVVLLIVFATAARRQAIICAIISLCIMGGFSVASTHFAGNQKFSEAVGIPLQLVGAVVVDEKAESCLDEQSKEYFNKLMPFDVWRESYSSTSVDSTKFSLSFDRAYLQESKKEFLINWTKVGLQCPSLYLQEYAVHTSQLWRVDAHPVYNGNQSYFTSVVTNEDANNVMLNDYANRGIVNESKLPAAVTSAVDAYVNFMNQHSPGAGTWLWLMILAISGFVYRRRKEWIAIFAPSLIILMTLMVSVPVARPFRYFEYLTLVVPVGYLILLGISSLPRQCPPQVKQTEGKSEGTNQLDS